MENFLLRVSKIFSMLTIIVGVLIVLFLNMNKNMERFECPKHALPSPNFCKDGIIITGLKYFRGCNIPPSCFKDVSMKPPLRRINSGNNEMIQNPAAVYCKALGYKFEVVNTEKGQIGYCIFPDGSNCTAWSFFAGECGEEWELLWKILGRNNYRIQIL